MPRHCSYIDKKNYITAFGLFLLIGVSIGLISAGLSIILSNHYDREIVTWSMTTIGSIFGFWSGYLLKRTMSESVADETATPLVTADRRSTLTNKQHRPPDEYHTPETSPANSSDNIA